MCWCQKVLRLNQIPREKAGAESTEIGNNLLLKFVRFRIAANVFRLYLHITIKIKEGKHNDPIPLYTSSTFFDIYINLPFFKDLSSYLRKTNKR